MLGIVVVDDDDGDGDGEGGADVVAVADAGELRRMLVDHHNIPQEGATPEKQELRKPNAFASVEPTRGLTFYRWLSVASPN